MFRSGAYYYGAWQLFLAARHPGPDPPLSLQSDQQKPLRTTIESAAVDYNKMQNISDRSQ